MSELDTELLQFGFDWTDIQNMTEVDKAYEIAWEARNWNQVIYLQSEHGLGTPDEVDMAQRYKERADGGSS